MNIPEYFEEHIKLASQVSKSAEIASQIEQVCSIITKAFRQGKKVLLVGNGGSAADAQHIAAEFTGRFLKERRGLPAIALTTDTSALTAIANDYGYEKVFTRQVEALANEGDVLIALSTSGNSPSIVAAIHTAIQKQCVVVGFTGRDGGAMRDLCAVNIIIPSTITSHIQEMHITIGHIVCQCLDEIF